MERINSAIFNKLRENILKLVPQTMEKILGKLSTDFRNLLDDEEDYNVIINVGNISNFKQFRAHSNVLRYRSLYFKNQLLNAKKDENNIKTIQLLNIPIQQFDFIIK
ncbi:hypothetical protein C2G38_755924 [Gigaspora rosea]|uniref:BTB domain-containing protein n=1 Tax=Gigaspora rosea TaxID=44941 RepID=A0A397VQG0_9GLOM|nr:hypothetical protein C2G38_755924 [Gigaspora rosea]